MDKTVTTRPQNALIQWVNRPPMVLPLIALAHVVALVYTLVTALQMGAAASWYWLQPLWLLLYTICWLGACSLRKWGVYTYVLLTVINSVSHIAIKDVYWGGVVSSNLFLVDILFSFFLMIYIKRFK
jgi:hypothetical protein